MGFGSTTAIAPQPINVTPEVRLSVRNAFIAPTATEKGSTNSETINKTIDYYCNKYGVKSWIIKTLVKKESSYNINAVHWNDGKMGLHSYGMLQFQPPTFLYFNVKFINMGILDTFLDIDDWQHQIIMATLMVKYGYCYHWTTCPLN